MPKNLGMGGGGTAYLDEYHANFVNPANLSLPVNSPHTTVGLLGGLSTDFGGPLLNVGVYNDYFTSGAIIKGSLADEVFGQWFGSNPEEMKKMSIQTDIVPLGLAHRHENWGIAIAARSRFMINTSANIGFAQLGMMGLNTDIFKEGRPVNFAAEGISFHELSAGLSVKLLDFGAIRLHAGAAPKLLLGASATRVNFNSVLTLHTDDNDQVEAIRHQFAYQLETTGELSHQLQRYYNDRQTSSSQQAYGDYLNPAAKDYYNVSGTGLGIDLGATAEMDIEVPILGALSSGTERLRIGASLTDIGEFSFSDDIGRFVADDELYWRGFDFDSDRIDEEFNGDRGQYMEYVLTDSIAQEIYGSYVPAEVKQIHQKLPTKFNLGGI